MNILFAIAIATASLVAFNLVLWAIPERVWNLIPEEILDWKRQIIRTVNVLIFLAIVGSDTCVIDI